MIHYGCPTCHVIPGVPGAVGKVGPSLDGSPSDRISLEHCKTLRTISFFGFSTRSAFIPGTAMPEMGVTPEDAKHIAGFLANAQIAQKKEQAVWPARCNARMKFLCNHTFVFRCPLRALPRAQSAPKPYRPWRALVPESGVLSASVSASSAILQTSANDSYIATSAFSTANAIMRFCVWRSYSSCPSCATLGAKANI